MPTKRGYLAIGVVNNKIYAIGGDNGVGHEFNENEEYDASTDTWATKSGMPTARGLLAIGVVNNSIYTIGGWDGSKYLSVNEEYNLISADLIISTILPNKVYANTSVSFNATIINMGYINATGKDLNITFTIDVNILGNINIQNFNIPVNENITVSAPVNWLAPKTIGTPTLTLSFYTDIGGGTPGQYPMAEENYANNTGSIAVTVYVSDSKDTDSDGMPDGWEYNNSLNLWNAADAGADPDSDGLTNLQEYQNGTNPNNPDTDSDGMPDGWEVNNDLNPLVNDAAGDADNDNLKNLAEYKNNTNPQNPDTDSDGMPDGWEVSNGFNPISTADASKDADNDNLTNLNEYKNNTHPKNPDTDSDKIPDGWEVKYGLNPLIDIRITNV